MCVFPCSIQLSYRGNRCVYSLCYSPQVLIYYTNVFPVIVPVRTFLCSRFFGCPCYRYTQTFHTLSNKLSYWFSLRFQIFNTSNNKKTRSCIESGFKVSSKVIALCHASEHTFPDSYKFLIRFIKVICSKSCHHFFV